MFLESCGTKCPSALWELSIAQIGLEAYTPRATDAHERNTNQAQTAQVRPRLHRHLLRRQPRRHVPDGVSKKSRHTRLMKHFHEEFALVFRRLVRGSERAVQNGKAKLGARCSTGRGQWCVMFPEARAFPRKRARVSGKTRRTRDVGEYKKGDDERARDTEEKPRRVWKTSAKCRHQKKRTLGEENPRQSSQSSLPLRARRCVKKPLLETPLCLRFAARRRSTCGRCAKATFSCGSWRRWACSFSASSTVSLTASDFLNFEIYVVETTSRGVTRRRVT